MSEKNLYEILGVKPDCDQSTLRDSYRSLCQKHHPDKKDGDTETFQTIKQAYDVLSDPERRKLYDKTGEYTTNKQAMGPVHEVLSKHFQDEIKTVIQSSTATGIAQLAQQQSISGDIIDRIRVKLSRRNEQLNSGIMELDRNIEKLKKINGAINRNDDEENIFDKIMQANIKECHAAIENLKKEVAINELAVEELQKYTYTGKTDIQQAYQSAINNTQNIYW